MSGEVRRTKIIQMLSQAQKPISGLALSKELQVSRQVIVQDIALLRANGSEIISTNRGYLMSIRAMHERVFKVHHEDDEVGQELNAIVDMGGQIQDVLIFHKIYGTMRAHLNIKSRMDVEKYLKEIDNGKSNLLKNVTSGYHYHTVTAENEELLDMIQEKLEELGFLAKLQDYEPVDFWENQKSSS
ncbi:MAG: transcription repressor NadR [Anaerostipes sp.]|nr:transcription repressor NadR [Anaerostipes sp.]MDD4370983.1 transcription repressor NadR [Anaerostipes sp.]